MLPKNYDWKDYRAPSKSSLIKNVAIAVAITVIFLTLGYLGEQDHLAKLDQITIAKQEK